ncbi:hypothetical protein Fuma_01272 [Fuerstiella marisgermanici]|uniref:FHA domain-containing protein n=1 Tax=Fuerstiella marisgermanici TaxID=1891926 RepID=A0A1P8WC93_9PLAN|nr:hypothetical protein Fuma_01272 [Fuerstiella marisgermanici]
MPLRKASHLFNLNLKRTETAIRSGRLDDAFALLQASPERGHRDGQTLIDRLAAAFTVRATEHLTAARLEDARHDANKALQLAGRSPEVAKLLAKVSTAEKERHGRQQRRQDVLATAEQQLNAGAYSIGAKLLGGLDADQSTSGAAAAGRLEQAIAAKRMIIDDAVQRIQTAVDAGEFTAAANLISSLQPDQRFHARIAPLLNVAVEPLIDAGVVELVAGRLDRAAAIADSLSWLRVQGAAPGTARQSGSPSYDELQQCLDRCRTVKRHLASHDFSSATAELNLLRRVIPDAEWVREAQTAVAEALQLLNSLAAGPLGLLPNSSASADVPSRPVAQNDDRLAGDIGGGTPGRCVLRVDGIGGLLLLRKDIVTIGAISSPSSAACDLRLQTEGATTAIRIRRESDDYFAESEEAFKVNGLQVTRKLLANGDSIAVGSRGRLRFLKPVAASGSAVLHITGSKLEQRDIRNVVLMSDSLLFGPNGSHFRLPNEDSPIVLHCDAGGYALRSLQAGSEWMPLRLGQSVLMNDVRFALTE